MIVHIGYESCIDTRELIAVIDKARVGDAPDTKAFIARAKAEGRFTPCPEGERAYVLLSGSESTRVIASALRGATLAQRLRADGL